MRACLSLLGLRCSICSNSNCVNQTPSKIDRLLAECTLKFAAFGISIEPAPNDRALIVRASIQDIRSGVSDRSAPIPSTFLD